MKSFYRLPILHFCLLFINLTVHAQKLAFTVSMDNPAIQKFQVKLQYEALKAGTVELKMPNWSPGYYQRMNYPKNVDNFRVTDKNGKDLPWAHTNNTT